MQPIFAALAEITIRIAMVFETISFYFAEKVKLPEPVYFHVVSPSEAWNARQAHQPMLDKEAPDVQATNNNRTIH